MSGRSSKRTKHVQDIPKADPAGSATAEDHRTTPSSALAEQPVLTLIQALKAKEVNPTLLSTEDRRRCVEVLRGEGYTIAAIAQILQKNERTIRRDVESLRVQNAMAYDPRLPERMIGQLVNEAEHSMGQLRRLARDTNARRRSQPRR